MTGGVFFFWYKNAQLFPTLSFAINIDAQGLYFSGVFVAFYDKTDTKQCLQPSSFL